MAPANCRWSKRAKFLCSLFLYQGGLILKHCKKAVKIIERLHAIARLYQRELVGKTFLILYEGNKSEVIFKSENFLHLCGVETNLSAKHFFKCAIRKSLTPKNIFFSQSHPYNLCEIKTKFMPQAISLFKKDSLAITDISTQTRQFKLGTTDLDVVFCFDEDSASHPNIARNILFPCSLRVEDIPNSKFNNMYEVNYVLSKKTGTKNYINIEYGNPNLLTSYLEKYSISDYSINISNQNSSTK